MTSAILAGRRYLAVLFCVMFPVAALAASSNLSFTAHSLNLNPGDSVGLLAVDAEGNVYEAGNVLDSSGNPRVQVTRTDPNGQLQLVGSYQFGSGEKAMAITVDSHGSVIVAGTGYEADFPGAHVYGTPTALQVVFVAKLDPQLAGITAAALIGGNNPMQGAAPYQTYASAVATDAAGEIYVGGSVSLYDFPVTPGAYAGGGLGFVAEFTPGLDALVFSSRFGGFGFQSMVLDSSGAVTAIFNGGLRGSAIEKIAPRGGSVLWGNELGVVQTPTALAVDANNDVIVVGYQTGVGDSLPPSTLQSCPGTGASGMVEKLAGDTGSITFLTDFGCQVLDCNAEGVCFGNVLSVNGVDVDASGTIWVTGQADPSSLPVTPSTPGGPTYLAAIAPDGSSVEALYTGGAGMFGQALALTPAGSPVALGDGILMLPNSSGGPSLLGVGNSAGSAASAVIAPTELVSFYGTGLGPAAPLSAQVVNSVVQSSLGGYQLLMGGVAAPLLYVGANQINAVVPIEMSAQDAVPVSLVTPAGTFPLADLYVRPSDPEIFHDPVSGYAIAVNQDGTFNSETNPAHAGQIVSIWATGAGLESGFQTFGDGWILAGLDVKPVLPLSVLVNAQYSLEVDYAADAPGDVLGMVQVNFRLQEWVGAAAGTLMVSLQVGSAIGAPVGLYVAP